MNNEFKFLDPFHDSEVNWIDVLDAENFRKTMYIHFTIYENLPHRMAYHHKDYFIVSSDMEEDLLFKNNLASSVALLSGDDHINNIQKGEITYKGMV